MKIDDTLLEVLTNVQKELMDKGEDFSIQELAIIAESQFIAGNLAFKKGLEVRLPIFGTFVRKHGLEMAIASNELKEITDSLTKEEKDKKVFELKMKHIEKRKKRQKHMTKVTFNFLKATPDIVKVKNKLDKLL